jgi:hypothetical protein
MEASQYAASVNMIKENQLSKGNKVDYDKSINETKKDTTSFEKSKSESYNKSSETLKTKEQPSANLNSSRSKLTVVSVNVTGVGFNSKDAIKDGLLQAISQVNGLQMSSQTTSAMASFETLKNGNETFVSSSSFQEEIKQKTKGVIQSWKIISTGKSQSGKMFQAKIDVNVSKLQLSSELKRMRFVVSPIRISKNINDLSIAKQFAKTFNSNLRSMLVKSNRFALLDRKNSRELNKEINIIKGSNVRVEELAKLGNKVGADYIIIASLQKLNNRTIKQKLMGETISSKELNTDLAISVIDIATSQIIFSDNMSLSQGGGSLSKFAKVISNRLSRKITDTFFPAKLIALEDNKMTVDQGSSFFNKKSKYNIIKLGARVVDQTTNEFSGRVEEVIGEATFLEGTGKQSTLKIDKLSKNKKLLNINGSIIIRPIFKPLPSASDIAKAKIKKIKSKNQKMMKKIDKDKDW